MILYGKAVMQLKSSPKVYKGYKCDSPGNTIKHIKKKLEKLGLSFTYKPRSISSAGLSLYSGDLVLDDFGFTTTGKGVSHLLAKASAYAEMAERISAGFLVFYNLNNHIAEYTSVWEDIIKRSFLPGYTICDNDRSGTLNKLNDYFREPLSSDQYETLKKQGLFDILIDSYSLIKKEYYKIPINFIEMVSGSIGLAAGNTMEEAIVQGTCEIFERFAASHIISNEIICPTIKIDSIDDQQIQNYVDMLDSLNINVTIKDFTLGDSLPVIGVLFTNHNIENDKNKLKKNRYYQLIDVGCHLNLKEAIIRCFTERLQEMKKEELLNHRGCDVLYNFWKEKMDKSCENIKEEYRYFFRDYYYHNDLSFLEKGKTISFDSLHSEHNNDSLDDIQQIKNICKDNNWDLSVVDCTHKEIEFPVTRIIIPPISTDSNPFVRRLLEFADIEKQFNFFYGIEGLYEYYKDDSWLQDRNRIKQLIKTIEKSLSKDLFSFEFNFRRGPFYQCINLFHVLAFAHLAIGEKIKGKKYLEFLQELQETPYLNPDFFDELYNPGFDSDIYQEYLDRLKAVESEDVFTFTSHPFHPTERKKSPKEGNMALLRQLRDSFF